MLLFLVLLFDSEPVTTANLLVAEEFIRAVVPMYGLEPIAQLFHRLMEGYLVVGRAGQHTFTVLICSLLRRLVEVV